MKITLVVLFFYLASFAFGQDNIEYDYILILEIHENKYNERWGSYIQFSAYLINTTDTTFTITGRKPFSGSNFEIGQIYNTTRSQRIGANVWFHLDIILPKDIPIMKDKDFRGNLVDFVQIEFKPGEKLHINQIIGLEEELDHNKNIEFDLSNRYFVNGEQKRVKANIIFIKNEY